MFETHAFELSRPRLPMLIPCPGPQFTLCMYTFEHPVCIDTQSSPAQSISTPELVLVYDLTEPFVRADICC